MGFLSQSGGVFQRVSLFNNCSVPLMRTKLVVVTCEIIALKIIWSHLVGLIVKVTNGDTINRKLQISRRGQKG